MTDTRTLPGLRRVRRWALAASLLSLFFAVDRAPRAAQTWQAAGSMPAARASHHAYLLSDGRVFVAGSQNPGGGAPDLTTLFFAPATALWSAGPSAALDHSDSSSVRLADGRILVTGGRNGASALTTSEMYNPATNAWAATSPMNVARVLHSLTLLPDGKVLAAGGYNVGFDNSAEIFNPVTGQWSMTGSMSVGKWQHTATLLDDGRVLIAGGENYNCCGQKLTIAEFYSPADGTWTPAPPLSLGRAAHRAAKLADGRVLIAGGAPDFVAPTASTEIFNPATSAWQSAAPMRLARDSFPLLTLGDGTLLAAGGRVSFAAGAVTNATERYDPSTDTWSAGPSMNSPRQYHSATLLGDGRVLVAGGHDGSVFLSSAEVLVDDAIAPSTTANPSPAPNAAGWNNSNVTLILNAADNAGGSGVQSIVYTLTGAQSASATVAATSASVAIVNEGATTVTYHAIDRAGNAESDHTLTIRIDKTPPMVSGLPNSLAATATSSAGAVVAFSIGPVPPSDALSGLASIGVSPLASGSTFPPGTTHEVVTVFDVAGNSASGSFDVTVSPGKPRITVTGGLFAANGQPHPAVAMATDAAGNSVAGTFTITYAPGGAAAPAAPGRYSATATFTSSDPAFTSTAYPWVAMAPDPHAKASPAVAEIGGRLYVVGFDQDAAGNQSSFVPRLSIYDPASNSWTIGASPSLVRAFANAAAIDGKLYVVGGCVMSDCRIGVSGARALEIYDPATNSWSAGASMPSGRFGAAAGVVGGRLYVTGGTTECPPCGTSNATEIYDPLSNSWTNGAPIPTSRELAAGAVVNGLLYVIGGYERGAVNAPVGTVSVYDRVANSWSTRSPMPLARSGAAVGVINGEIYVVGGSSASSDSAINEKYNPATDVWTEQAPMLTARHYAAGGAAGSRLYVFDGANGAPLAANEAYDSSNDATALITIAADNTPPTTTAISSPAANAAGWNRTNVTVALTAADQPGGTGVQSIVYTLTGGQSGSAAVAGSSASIQIVNEGTTTITYHAVDAAGNVEADHTLIAKVDKTLPFVSFPFQVQTTATSSAGALVTFVVSGSDNGSGLAAPATVSPLSSGSMFPPGITHETVTATDLAGNVATGTFDVVVNPARPIVNVIGGTFTADGNPHPATATARDSSNAAIAGSFSFTYAPGAGAPVAPGRYSATASFASSDPAFTDALAWTTKARDPHPKNSPAAAAIDGKVYVVGFDQDAAGNQSSFAARLGIYDPFTDAWTAGAAPHIIRAYANAAAIGGKLYVVGGCVMSDCRIGVTGALEIYDPAHDAWTSGASMPTGRFGAAAGVINGKLVVAGGTSSCPPCGTTSATEIYDPATNSWTSGAPIPSSRELAAGAVVNNLFYVIGGYDRAVNASVGTLSVYDPVANTWSTRTAMPTPRNGAAVGVLNGEIYVIGGVGSSAPLAISESYDPFNDGWTPRQPMPTPRSNVAGAVVYSTMYAIDGAGLQTANEAYDASLSAIVTILPGDTTPPTTTAILPAPNANGWNRFDVNVNLNAFDPASGGTPSGVQTIVYTLAGAQTGGGAFNTSSTSFTIVNEGTTTVTYHAIDNRGNVEADHTLTIRLDKTPPAAASLSNITASATSTSGAVVTFDLAATDAQSGVDTVVFTQGLPSGSTFPHGTTNESVTITDKAGNTTFRGFSLTVNKALLSISVSPASQSIRTGHQSQSVTAIGHFTQGADQALPTSASSTGGTLVVPANAPWQATFSPSLNLSACGGSAGAGFGTQPVTRDSSGAVHTTWGAGVQVRADGTLTPQSIDLTLTCASNSSVPGILSATWTGTRYAGTATLSGQTVGVDVTGWSTKAPATPRFALGAVSVGGFVYAMGGGDPSQPSPVEKYDPAANSWSTVAEMQTPREGAAVAALNGKIYVAGGRVAGGAASGVFEAFDPATNSWQQLPPMPTPRAHLSLVAAGGTLYAIGGDTGSSHTPSAVVERYDPAAPAGSEWTMRAPMLAARTFLAAGALNGDAMIVAAGTSTGGGSTELYDVATDTWTAGPAMLSPVSGIAAAVVNNALFVFGGTNNGGLTLTHMFKPAAGQQAAGWVALASMPTARGELAAAAIGDLVYVVGGLANGSPTGAVEAFSTPPPSGFFASSGGSASSLPIVSWQSTNSSIASIDGSGVAMGISAGQTTIVATAAGISCAATNSCATLTVTEPPHITLALTPGSEPFATVQVTAVDPTTGEPFGTFDVPVGVAQEVQPGGLRVRFAAPAGYTVAPAQIDLDLHDGDNVTIPLLFALADTTPPVLTVPGNRTAEATSPAGASVSFAAATAVDSESGVQSVSCDRASGDLFPFGPTAVHCTAIDNAGNIASASFVVTVVDTTKPIVTVPAATTVEASSIAGAVVSFASSAVDNIDGARAVSCSPASGSTFVIGTTTVTCSASDSHGNTGSATFFVFVRDTTAPIVQIVSPRASDVFLPGSFATVQLDVSEAVRLAQVLVNNGNAAFAGFVSPTTQRWIAGVQIPAAGSSFTVSAIAFDIFGNRGTASVVFDNDGIDAAIDRNRTTGADESSFYSSDFNIGGTAGTVWRLSGAVVSASKVTPDTVRVGMLNSGLARISVCTGTDKYIELNAPGEGVDIRCAATGTVTATAYAGIGGTVEIYKQTVGTYYTTQRYCTTVGGFFNRHTACFTTQVPHTYTYYYQIVVPTFQTVSTGSPVTASADNTEPIQVTLMQVDDDGTQNAVADFVLDPGASVDVAVTPVEERQDQISFSVLHGEVSFNVEGVTQTAREGEQALVALDFTPPVLDVPAEIVVDATTAAGAVVTFGATANDRVDGPRPVSCTPASGSTFAIGTTTVSCSAADTRGNASTRSFTVTVLSAAQIVTDLGALVEIDSFQQGRNLLDNVLRSLDSGNLIAACGQLSAFVGQVQAQAGKKLTPAEAAALIGPATDVRGILGCK